MSRKRTLSFSGASVIERLEQRKLLAAGALDTSFDGDGKATIRFGLSQAIPYTLDASDVAVQSDGKTVVAGTFRPVSGSGQQDFAVARFNLDGTLDQTFGDRRSKGIAFVHVGKRAGKDQ